MTTINPLRLESASCYRMAELQAGAARAKMASELKRPRPENENAAHSRPAWRRFNLGLWRGRAGLTKLAHPEL